VDDMSMKGEGIQKWGEITYNDKERERMRKEEKIKMIRKRKRKKIRKVKCERQRDRNKKKFSPCSFLGIFSAPNEKRRTLKNIDQRQTKKL
jgi:hypothetical protein